MTRDEIKQSLEAEYGMKTNPKRHKLFALAWEFGHAHGVHEVAFYYEELMELVDETK